MKDNMADPTSLVSAPRTDPRTPHQPGDAAAAAEVVRSIWAEVLEVDVESIDVHRGDFFELGGYSLLALQAIGRILAQYGVGEVESVEWEGELLNRLFENATPLAQAEFLAERGYGRPGRAR
ncbi:acyl carrier protein [Streptomyces sp. 4503]|uniref:Acyl carrier protein n=1 Tax=Streptomyces niphimycinicus TaxID=2842201 RepID=A0ABS6CE95_9ACTN|nr:acyl carrier protein [Streptomyces niphimycinicus]MBU3865110.1 acyl carrier protein [Streptomyces niphimycinicus]